MRISDWISDVCSSDLDLHAYHSRHPAIRAARECRSPRHRSPITEIRSSSSWSSTPQLLMHRKPTPKLLRQAPLRQFTSAASLSSPTTAALHFTRPSEQKSSKQIGSTTGRQRVDPTGIK